MPAELSDNLKIAGLTHIVVASGYNLTILVRLASTIIRQAIKIFSDAQRCCYDHWFYGGNWIKS